jgi:hypothetical protein
MFDAPASAAVIVSLYFCARYVRAPTRGAAAAGRAAVALSFKWNAAVVLVCPLLALVLGASPAGGRWVALAGGILAVAVALLLTSPVMVLEPARVLEPLYWVWDYFAHLSRQVTRQGGLTYGLGAVLRNGLGVPLLGAALLGALAAVRHRERALVPLLVFIAVYGWIAWRSPLIFNRYALPLAPPVAALAAYGLHRWAPFPIRVGCVAALVVVGLPPASPSLADAREDTRVASARWLREHVRPDAQSAPRNDHDRAVHRSRLPRPLAGTGSCRPSAEELGRRIAALPRTRRYFSPGKITPGARWDQPARAVGERGDRDLRAAGGSVRARARRSGGARPGAPCPTPPGLPGRAGPRERTYEPDLNYAPIRGMSTLLRPAAHPHLVRAADRRGRGLAVLVDRRRRHALVRRARSIASLPRRRSWRKRRCNAKTGFQSAV